MTLSSETIKAKTKKVLSSLEKKLHENTLAKIRTIIAANLDRGRVQRFIGDDIARVEKYVNHVVEQFQELSPLLHQLQVSQSTDAWLPLYEELQQWAYNFFLNKGFYPGQETKDVAIARATDAAVEILSAHFPYDTDFKPWAHVILQNTCRKFVRESTKKSIIPQKQLSRFDKVEHLLSQISQENNRKKLQLEDIAEELREAVQQLSKSRRLVIEYYYFQGLSLPEIAEEMGKTVNAVYSLHFNALKDLRKILDQNRNKLDE